MIVNISDISFEDDIKNNGLVLVYFWAPWCNPCKILSPIMEELSIDFINKVKIFKLDIDHNPNVCEKLNIKSVPTLIMFKDGIKLSEKIGIDSQIAVKSWISSISGELKK